MHYYIQQTGGLLYHHYSKVTLFMKLLKTSVAINPQLTGILTIFLVKLYTFVMVWRFNITLFCSNKVVSQA